MMVGIVVLTVIVYPFVLGQSLEFEQECHVLKTLENFETRLKEQDTRIKEQDALLKEQDARLVEQDARLRLQETLLEQDKANSDKQGALLGHLNATLENQEVLLQQLNATLGNKEDLIGHLNATLETQQARISELVFQLNASKQSTNDQGIGFTASFPFDAENTGVMRFTEVVTNEGGGYNSSTGEFHCSVAGLYFFIIHLVKKPASSVGYVRCNIHTGRRGDLAIAYTNPASDAYAGYYAASSSSVVYLPPGESVRPGNCSPASTIHHYSFFSGFLIRAG